MAIREAYRNAAREHAFTPDPAQERIVARLERLQQEILAQDSALCRLRRRLPFVKAPASPEGIYLWGGVGRGKTFLMDLFFTTLPVARKRRIHFHRMMSDVHARLKALPDVSDPLGRVADDIAAETRVLCFDEFFVSDIADAMLLGRLLGGLFERGVTLVATSNSPPHDLYRDGLQRQQFLPAIAAIQAHTEIIELDGDSDYRLALIRDTGTYLDAADPSTGKRLEHYFEEIASGEMLQGESIEVLGRPVSTLRCAKGIAWFAFADLCGGPRSQEDYIEIARWYPTVIVSDIPQLTRKDEDAARRFISLVDEFYDRRVKLVASAAVDVDELYRGRRLDFEFERTASRLKEMQSAEYLHAAHLA